MQGKYKLMLIDNQGYQPGRLVEIFVDGTILSSNRTWTVNVNPLDSIICISAKYDHNGAGKHSTDWPLMSTGVITNGSIGIRRPGTTGDKKVQARIVGTTLVERGVHGLQLANYEGIDGGQLVEIIGIGQFPGISYTIELDVHSLTEVICTSFTLKSSSVGTTADSQLLTDGIVTNGKLTINRYNSGGARPNLEFYFRIVGKI